MIKFDINIIKWIQSNLRNNFFDYLFYGITQLGDQYAFILVVAIIYWTIDKKFAYKMFFGFLGTSLVNSGLKVLFKRPRPYLDIAIDSVFTETHGYSFPSGHSSSIGSLSYSIYDEYGRKNRTIKIILLLAIILVPFSRMYLGQHYLTDVLAGVGLGVLTTLLMFKIFDKLGDKEHIYALYLIPVIIIVMLIFMGGDYSKFKDMFVAGGAYIGFSLGYYLEKEYVKLNVKANLLTNILKVIIGLIGVVIIYVGIKAIPVTHLLFDSLRYLLMAAFAAVGAPYLFTKIFKQN